MVQTYGVVPEISAEPSLHADESRALLAGPSEPGTPSKSLRDRNADGHATLISCISNLLNTIIGSGMLTFPLAMASAGLIPGVITCALSGCIGGFGLYLLSRCAPRANYRHASFHAISKLTFPRAAVFFDAAIATKCFGVSISYLIIIKGLMPNVVASLYHDLTAPTTNPPEWALNGNNWITIFMVVLVPLCFLRHLNSLRHTSYIALFSVAYLVVIVVRGYIWPFKGMAAPGEIRLIHFTPDFVSTFPIQVFAFTCAQNLFPIYNELKDNSQSRMNIVIGGSIGGATLTYEVISVLGYLTFGSKVGANIIAMYPATSIFIAVGQLAIAILVLFSYPLQVHPCRNCLDKVFHFGQWTNAVKPTVAGDEEEEEEDDDDDDDHGHNEMSKLKHFWLTTAIVISGFTLAYLVDDLQIVLSFVGATGSTTISFILPGLLYWKLTRNDARGSKTLNMAAFGLMVYGICVFVFCLGYNVYKVVRRR
ncbi:vacuolar amino acid transporter 5 [Phlegmacium glaucopus]|nr:vacuolar amino acid transporter 5 [Phlegmacium glaucopus]